MIPRIYPTVFIHPPVYIVSGIRIFYPVHQGWIVLRSSQTITERQVHTQIAESKHGIDVPSEFRIGYSTGHFITGIPIECDITEAVDKQFLSGTGIDPQRRDDIDGPQSLSFPIHEIRVRSAL